LTPAHCNTYHHLPLFNLFTLREITLASSRIEIFQKMLASEPGNTTVRFGLANELLKSERFAEAAAELQTYLSQTDDQGAAYGMLARALERLNKTDEAHKAYEQGIAAAQRHGHPGMAQEFELAKAELL
jgi:E3 SUMO-protein ligase RanBP2